MASFFRRYKTLFQRAVSYNRPAPILSDRPLAAMLPLDQGHSVLSGMTRDSWREAARLLLDGVFAGLREDGSPMELSRAEFEVTYPHGRGSDRAMSAARFEGLVRTFLLASVLLAEEPSLTLHGIPVARWYKQQLLLATAPDGYAGTYDSYAGEAGTAVVQQAVECGLLVVGLQFSKRSFWDGFSLEEQEQVLSFLEGYARGNLPSQNWLLSALMIFAFLEQNGRPGDRVLSHRYARRVAALYAGDGWYRDGTAFDYYSCWAFQTFAPLWCLWYGDQFEPEIATHIRQASDALMGHFPALFSSDGRMIFWGRSAMYRCAHLGALFGNICLHEADGGAEKCPIPPGRMRALASQAVRVFLERRDLLANGVLAPGLFGVFSPALQSYSCSGSAYWMSLAFLFLALPAEHPFWTAEEQPFFPPLPREEKAGRTPQNICLDAPGLALSAHPANGAAILRTGKVLLAPGAGREAAWYAKLSYHAHWPPEMDGAVSQDGRSVASQQYVLSRPDTRPETCNAVFWCGEEAGILYRRAFFSFVPGKEWQWLDSLFLADFPVPLGLFHVCRADLLPNPLTLTLGSWGFPADGAQVSRIPAPDGTPTAEAICLRSVSEDGKTRQMAMTVWGGWDNLQTLIRTGLNPLWNKSMLITAAVTGGKGRGYGLPLLFSQFLSREDEAPFTEEELFPLSALEETEGGALLRFRSGEIRRIDFLEKEGRLAL